MGDLLFFFLCVCVCVMAVRLVAGTCLLVLEGDGHVQRRALCQRGHVGVRAGLEEKLNQPDVSSPDG